MLKPGKVPTLAITVGKPSHFSLADTPTFGYRPGVPENKTEGKGYKGKKSPTSNNNKRERHVDYNHFSFFYEKDFMLRYASEADVLTHWLQADSISADWFVFSSVIPSST